MAFIVLGVEAEFLGHLAVVVVVLLQHDGDVLHVALKLVEAFGLVDSIL